MQKALLISIYLFRIPGGVTPFMGSLWERDSIDDHWVGIVVPYMEHLYLVSQKTETDRPTREMAEEKEELEKLS
jgi:hypothetical protein